MPSLESNALEVLSLNGSLVALLGRVHLWQGRQDLYASARKDVLEELLQAAITKGTESSNGIEGIVVDPERYRALMLDHKPPETTNEFLLLSYRDALDFIHSHHSDLDVTPEVILDLHKRIHLRTSEVSGRLRAGPAVIVRRQEGHEPVVVYTASPPELVERQLQALCANYRRLEQDPNADSFILMAGFVLDFLCIHPFENGNGRVSRLLTTLLAYKAGFDLVRYIALERIVAETKGSYYWALTESSRQWARSQHDWRQWIQYLAATFLRGYEELEGRLREAGRRGHKSDRVRDAVAKAPSRFTIRQIINDCPSVTRPTIVKVLAELRDAGEIVSVGKGPSAYYQKMSVLDATTGKSSYTARPPGLGKTMRLKLGGGPD